MADTRFQLCDFSLDGSLQSARVHIERERAIGVYDLLEDNRFIPVGHDEGALSSRRRTASRTRLRWVLARCLPAQKLVQARPGARGARLFYSFLPISGGWPDGVAVQIHGMDNDPILVGGATSTPPERSRAQSCSSNPAISTTVADSALPS